METGVGNKYYSPTHQLVIGRNELQLSEIKQNTDVEIQIEVGEEEIAFPIHLRFSKSEKAEGFVIDKSSDVAMLDFDKLRFPLTFSLWIRSLRNGKNARFGCWFRLKMRFFG